jgi:hypothetical protein
MLQREGAQIITTLAINATVQPTWDTSYHAQGWGRASGGSWEPGRYRVECRYGQRLVARNWFTVVEGGHRSPDEAPVATAEPLAGIDAHIQAIRLFEGGAEAPGRESRIYTNTFDDADTRYLYVEVTLGYSPAPRALEGRLTCRFLRDRTTEIGRVTLDYHVQRGERSRWSARGWGGRAPGAWAPGEYLVACDDGNTTLGQAGFTVT